MKRKPEIMNQFFGLDIEVLQEIENRLKAELKDKELPYHRKEEIESCLYHIKEAKRIKKGFYVEH
ncbi:hypothetical protein ES705_14735 [subsurface metagenome]